MKINGEMTQMLKYANNFNHVHREEKKIHNE